MSAVMRVRSQSDPHKVAGAVAGIIRERGQVVIQIIGAGALNQAVRAIVIAQERLAPQGLDVYFAPSFVDLVIDGEERTGIKLFVEPREPSMRKTKALRK